MWRQFIGTIGASTGMAPTAVLPFLCHTPFSSKASVAESLAVEQSSQHLPGAELDLDVNAELK